MGDVDECEGLLRSIKPYLRFFPRELGGGFVCVYHMCETPLLRTRDEHALCAHLCAHLRAHDTPLPSVFDPPDQHPPTSPSLSAINTITNSNTSTSASAGANSSTCANTNTNTNGATVAVSTTSNIKNGSNSISSNETSTSTVTSADSGNSNSNTSTSGNSPNGGVNCCHNITVNVSSTNCGGGTRGCEEGQTVHRPVLHFARATTPPPGRVGTPPPEGRVRALTPPPMRSTTPPQLLISTLTSPVNCDPLVHPAHISPPTTPPFEPALFQSHSSALEPLFQLDCCDPNLSDTLQQAYFNGTDTDGSCTSQPPPNSSSNSDETFIRSLSPLLLTLRGDLSVSPNSPHSDTSASASKTPPHPPSLQQSPSFPSRLPPHPTTIYSGYDFNGKTDMDADEDVSSSSFILNQLRSSKVEKSPKQKPVHQRVRICEPSEEYEVAETPSENCEIFSTPTQPKMRQVSSLSSFESHAIFSILQSQLRQQMLHYGLKLFRLDANQNYVCFFEGCNKRMTKNFSRHISRVSFPSAVTTTNLPNTKSTRNHTTALPRSFCTC
ncbi:hypothetical protein Pelo_10240 [Pelomyxa schiedti]|nr:hypothetical protein Pelo_10240 [Pelomyxa schiedti]